MGKKCRGLFSIYCDSETECYYKLNAGLHRVTREKSMHNGLTLKWKWHSWSTFWNKHLKDSSAKLVLPN